MRKTNRVTCEHCRKFIPVNVFSRNHGDKCPYKDAPKGYKMCKTCGEFIEVRYFATLSVNTYDGRNATCNACLAQKYDPTRKAV
jgi:hypothetical protein